MGINRFSDIEERKRKETDAKAGEKVAKGKKGDASSRVEAPRDRPKTPRNARSSRSSRSWK
jgi:hypothetical protein